MVPPPPLTVPCCTAVSSRAGQRVEYRVLLCEQRRDVVLGVFRCPASCSMPCWVCCCSCWTAASWVASARKASVCRFLRPGDLQDDRRLGEHLARVAGGQQAGQRRRARVLVGGVGDLHDQLPRRLVPCLVAGQLLVHLLQPRVGRAELLLNLVVLLVRLVELAGEGVDRGPHLVDARLRLRAGHLRDRDGEAAGEEDGGAERDGTACPAQAGGYARAQHGSHVPLTRLTDLTTCATLLSRPGGINRVQAIVTYG